MKPKQQAWLVYLNQKFINTVWFDSDMDVVQVYNALVGHDKLNPGIRLIPRPSIHERIYRV